MKKMRGFVDPISLGFLISAAIAGSATITEEKAGNDAQLENAPTEMVQQATAKAAPTAVEKNVEVDFPLY